MFGSSYNLKDIAKCTLNIANTFISLHAGGGGAFLGVPQLVVTAQCAYGLSLVLD